LKPALDVDDGHDQAGRNAHLSEPVGLAEHVLEDVHAFIAIGHATAQARLHHLVPDAKS
jgi:hypothetical protein